MIALLRQRNFGLLWFGGLISFIGDWVMIIALPVHVYNLTSSVLATGVMFMVSMLPSVLLSSVAGVYVDRWDRRRTMIAANLIVTPLILVLLFVQTAEHVWIVYAVALAISVVRQFMGPAENALLPKLVAEDELPTANALNTLNNNLARLIGPAVGGILIASFGFGWAVAFDAATFLVAAALITAIKAPTTVTRAQHESGSEVPAKKSVLGEWLEGMHLIRKDRLIRALFLFGGVAMISEGFFTVLIVVYVHETLGADAQAYGWMMTSQAVGGIVGSLFIGRLAKRVAPRKLVGPGLLLLGLIDTLIFAIPVLPLNLALFVMAGPPVIALHTGVQTLLQTNVADRLRGRVFGAFWTSISLMILLGMGIASTLGGSLGPTPILIAGGSFMALMGALATLVLPRLGSDTPDLTAEPQGTVSLGAQATAEQ